MKGFRHLNRLWINGNWTLAKTEFPVLNPSTDQVIANCANACPEQVSEAVEVAHTAFKEWQQVPARVTINDAD